MLVLSSFSIFRLVRGVFLTFLLPPALVLVVREPCGTCCIALGTHCGVVPSQMVLVVLADISNAFWSLFTASSYHKHPEITAVLQVLGLIPGDGEITPSRKLSSDGWGSKCCCSGGGVSCAGVCDQLPSVVLGRAGLP